MNEYVARSSQSPTENNAEVPSRKRHRIVERLSKGIDLTKTCKFTFRKFMQCVGSITRQDIEDQIKMLEARTVLISPLIRTPQVLRYLTQH